MNNKKKKDFDWQKGSRLTPDQYDHLGHVSDVGFTKLANGIYADPELRKQARKKKLEKPLKLKEGEFVFEESKSGISSSYTPSEADRYIHKGNEVIKGLGRFVKQVSKKSTSDKKKSSYSK